MFQESPCSGLRIGSVLSGVLCYRQSEYVFCSCLPPTNLMPFPSYLSTYHALLAKLLQFQVQRRTSRNFFSFFTTSQIEGLFLPLISATSAYNFFLSLLSPGELSPFHLKEALYGFSLAYPNCQRHYSCDSGILLSKIRVT